MSETIPEQRPFLVTTSWDDGHPLDMQVAERLRSRGMRGTFYVTFNDPGRLEIAESDIRELDAMGMEVGSHSLGHKILTGLGPEELERDLTESRRRLEDIVGHEVRSLSYPLGMHDRRVVEAARRAGYRLGRTTVCYRTSPGSDPLRTPISLEFFPFRRVAHVRHALRDRNVAGLAAWATAGRLATDPVRLAKALFARARSGGGVFHLYSRSWQVEQEGLWDALDGVLDHVSHAEGVRHETNAGVLAAVSPAGAGSA